MTHLLRLPLLTVALLVAGTNLPAWGPPMAWAAGLDAKSKADLKEATLLFKQRRYEEAEKLFTELRLNHPEMASLQRSLGLCYYYLRRPEPALFYFRDYLARNKDRISPEDREDVERWIEEIETLRVQSVAATVAPQATEPNPLAQPTVGPMVPGRPAPGSVPAPGPIPPLALPAWTAAQPPPAQLPPPAPYWVPDRSGYAPTSWGSAQGNAFVPPGPQRPGAGQPRPEVFAQPCEVEESSAGGQSPSPAYRRGFLALPYAGLQFPISAVYWITSGLRVGGLLGGHLSENVSLSGEVALATWTWNRPETWDHPAGGDEHRAAQIDLGVSLLRHLGWSWGEFIFGPKFGGSMILRHDSAEENRAFVNGFQAGVKIGLLKRMSDAMALGAVADFSYTINPVEVEANCYYYESANNPGEPNCTKTTNTFLGSLMAAMLF